MVILDKYVFIIIIIIIIPPKSVCVHRLIKITSYELSFRSQQAEINEIVRRHQLCYFS